MITGQRGSQLNFVPDAINGELYLWKGGTPYRVIAGGPLGLAVLDETGALRADQLPAGLSVFLQAGTGAAVRTSLSKARDVVHIDDFYDVGDTDTTAMQKAFDYIETLGRGTLHLEHGREYECGTLRQPGGLILEMNGATIKADPGLAANAALMFNKTTTGAVDATFDDDIIIRNGRFLCEIAADRDVELVSFIKCGNVHVEKVKVEGPRYIGMAFGGCKGVWIDKIKATGCGRVAVTAEGGPALWIGPAGDGSETEDAWVISPRISDCEWAGIYATSSSRVTISDPRIRNVKEAGIFGTVDRCDIYGGSIASITRKYISASAIEVGGANINIGGGMLIEECDNVAISLTDTKVVNIGQLTTKNCRRDPTTFPTAGHISIISLTASPGHTQDVTITGHRAYDTSSPSASAVSVAGQAPGSPMESIFILGNNYQGTAWTSGRAVDIDRDYWTDASCEHRNNFGEDDFSPTTVAVQQTTPQTLTDATPAAVVFDAAPVNSYLQWVVGTPTRITVQRAGRYRVTGQVAFVGNATGIRRANVFKNGAGFPGSGRAIQPTAGAGFTHNINLESAVVECVAGDYFELFAEQTSGGNLDTVNGSGQTWLSVQRV